MAVKTQQPKTSLDDAFKLLGRCEHCGTAKRTDDARKRSGAKTAHDAQKKKLSSRQKIDTQIPRQQEQLRHSNFFTSTSNTSTAMVVGRSRIIGA